MDDGRERDQKRKVAASEGYEANRDRYRKDRLHDEAAADMTALIDAPNRAESDRNMPRIFRASDYVQLKRTKEALEDCNAVLNSPGLTASDPLCAAWAGYVGTVQALGVAASFGDLSSAQLAGLELTSSPYLAEVAATIGESWPGELVSERAAVIDQRIGPYARRADRGQSYGPGDPAGRGYEREAVSISSSYLRLFRVDWFHGSIAEYDRYRATVRYRIARVWIHDKKIAAGDVFDPFQYRPRGNLSAQGVQYPTQITLAATLWQPGNDEPAGHAGASLRQRGRALGTAAPGMGARAQDSRGP